MNKELTPLDRLMNVLYLSTEPDLIKEGYLDISKLEKVKKKDVKRYLRLLVEMKWASEKVNKYPLYFENFYTQDDLISERDALEHHMHAFLEDITILKNRTVAFLGALKNDLKQMAINKDEIDEVLSHLKRKVGEGFKSIDDIRNPHSHTGGRFLDDDLVDMSVADLVLNEQNPLRKHFKEEFLKEVNLKKDRSFKRAKKRWVANANSVRSETQKLMNDIVRLNKSLLFQYLNLEEFATDVEKLQKDLLRENR